jgi:hypothetical protein
VDISLQLGFGDGEQFCAKKRRRRQIFFDEMEATISWDDFQLFIRPVYRQPSAKGGRPPLALEVMRGFTCCEVDAFYWTVPAPGIVNPGRVEQGSGSV